MGEVGLRKRTRLDVLCVKPNLIYTGISLNVPFSSPFFHIHLMQKFFSKSRIHPLLDKNLSGKIRDNGYKISPGVHLKCNDILIYNIIHK